MSRLRPMFAMTCMLAASGLGPARADEPKFEFGKMEEVKKVEWKASAAAGVTIASGNANVVTISGGAAASRNDGHNKLALDLNGVYAVSTIQVVTSSNPDGLIHRPSDISTQQKNTAGFFKGQLRYDRFFTKHNSVYLTAIAGLDNPASKQFFASVQAGYSRQIVKTRMHELLGEAGIDYSYINYAAQNDVHIASARLFVGYVLSPTEDTGLFANCEALVNFNTVNVGGSEHGFGDATRVNAKIGLTTKIWKALSLRAQTGLRYDNAPSFNSQLKFAPDYQAVADEKLNQPLDTLTEINLVVTFL